MDDLTGFVLHLPPDYHRLEFDFTALTFSSPENARFRYRLVGFDENWNETSEPRQAIYPRLPNGNYVFRVVGCSADGIWSQQEAQLAIAVAPFIWQTWWFQIGGAGNFRRRRADPGAVSGVPPAAPPSRNRRTPRHPRSRTRESRETFMMIWVTG